MDRIVIVTGGTRGIGLATAGKFLKEHDKLVILDRHSSEEAMETLRALGEVSFIPCDVFKAADCAQVVETVIRQYGRIDILVNVASRWRAQSLYRDRFAERLRHHRHQFDGNNLPEPLYGTGNSQGEKQSDR